MRTIDLNADIAEGFPFDHDLLRIVSSVNVCTGHHAGDPDLTAETVRLARSLGKRVGAHVGFPDRQSMGRRELEEGYPLEWIESVAIQIRASSTFAYIKPHGALFHWLANDPERSNYLWNVLEEMEKAFMGLPGTGHETQCRRRGIRMIVEGYCERGYDSAGSLLPRSQPGAVLTNLDDILAQAVRLASQVDSICVHGDRDDAVEVAYAVRTKLEEEGYRVTA